MSGSPKRLVLRSRPNFRRLFGINNKLNLFIKIEPLNVETETKQSQNNISKNKDINYLERVNIINKVKAILSLYGLLLKQNFEITSKVKHEIDDDHQDFEMEFEIHEKFIDNVKSWFKALINSCERKNRELKHSLKLKMQQVLNITYSYPILSKEDYIEQQKIRKEGIKTEPERIDKEIDDILNDLKTRTEEEVSKVLENQDPTNHTKNRNPICLTLICLAGVFYAHIINETKPILSSIIGTISGIIYLSYIVSFIVNIKPDDNKIKAPCNTTDKKIDEPNDYDIKTSTLKPVRETINI